MNQNNPKLIFFTTNLASRKSVARFEINKSLDYLKIVRDEVYVKNIEVYVEK